MHDPYRKRFDEGYAKLQGGKPRAADALFAKILAANPDHFLANFGHLVALYNLKETPRIRGERLETARRVLANAPRSVKGVVEQLAVRYASNALAYAVYSDPTSSQRDLLEGLRHVEQAAACDPGFDEQTAPVVAIRVELLMKLGRMQEAYALVHQVLEVDPSYLHFQSLKRTSGFKGWRRAFLEEQQERIAALLGGHLATELNCAMLRKVEVLNENKKRTPMKRRAIERIRMPARRGDRRGTQEAGTDLLLWHDGSQ